jgi:predicted GNAT superfamily acetyltransferase
MPMIDLNIVHKIQGKVFLLKAETSHKTSDYMKYEEIREEIWENPLDNLAGTRNMAAENFFNEGSSLFIAAYVEDESGSFTEDKAHLVGFSYGFAGVKDKEIGFRDIANIEFYSQYTGVKEEYQRYGLGVLIKEFQRKILRDVFGVYTVTCTFDPLSGINAYRNIHHFRMNVVDYLEDCYIDFAGKLNRLDVPADRFFVSWDLKSKPPKLHYDLKEIFDSGKCVIQTERNKVAGKNGPFQLDVIKGVDLSLEDRFLLVEIPFDFYRMLQETDVSDSSIREIPVIWRYKTREVLRELLQRGYSIIDFRYIEEEKRKRDFYLLSTEKGIAKIR